MKRSSVFYLLIISVFLSSCNRAKTDSDYIKKIEHNDETIAVGIYKATGYDYPNIQYIAEAIKIDGGLVYVTLTDADVLKTKLENIDVIVFPGMNYDQKIENFDDEIAEIIKKFILKGKGAVGICNGSAILSSTKKCQSLGLVDVELHENNMVNFSSGIIHFDLSDEGKQMFPELEEYENLLVDFHFGPEIRIMDTTSNIDVLAKVSSEEFNFPLLITAKSGKGKIAMINASPETTPGMRWMISRLVRWSANKEFKWYNKDVFRPGFFQNQLSLNEEVKAEIDSLIEKLDIGKKNDIISAMDKLEGIYPWVGAEKVRSLLIEKNDEIKLRAAKYLVDIEYTLALDDFKKVIKSERNRKVKEQLIIYHNKLDMMLEQN